MDFAWLSDPLLIYALALAALLFAGIFVLIFTIIIKHGSRLKSEKIQNHFTALLNEALQHHKKNQSILSELTQINSLIASNKKDVAYGWVRLLEKLSKVGRADYIAIAEQTHMHHCIPHCLNDEGMAEKCIALEAIGLSDFKKFISDAKKYAERNGIAPYACIALSRLTGIDALPQIIQSYKNGFLLTTQALAAIAEIPRDQILKYEQSTNENAIPAELARYLELN